MSDSESIGPAEDLAEALACRLTELNFPASLSYMPDIDALQLGGSVKIWVVPVAHESELRSRASNRHQVAAFVLIAKQLKKKTDVSEANAVARTVEQIKALWNDPGEGGILRHERLAGMNWNGTIQNSPLFDPGALYEKGRFISQITVTYGMTL